MYQEYYFLHDPKRHSTRMYQDTNNIGIIKCKIS